MLEEQLPTAGEFRGFGMRNAVDAILLEGHRTGAGSSRAFQMVRELPGHAL